MASVGGKAVGAVAPTKIFLMNTKKGHSINFARTELISF